MKIVLICPSNRMYMPYLDNYIKIFYEKNIDYNIINWDRFKSERENRLTYRDSKIGHKRNIFDYLKFTKFVLKTINKNDYDRLIVFGIQLVFFLKNHLTDKYNKNYIIDIRDYNRIIKFFRISKVFSGAHNIVLSSDGFKEWLPNNHNYIINHNTRIESLKDLEIAKSKPDTIKNIRISNIGTIRDFKINSQFINALKNNQKYKLLFHGEGIINSYINRNIKNLGIKNVELTGRYERENEAFLYNNTDLINVLIPNDSINSRTLLPNRLYNAVQYGKPIITFDGTKLSTYVNDYNLGIVIKDFNNTDEKIQEYLKCFSLDLYEKGRTDFLNNVLKDNKHFRSSIEKYIT